MLCPHCEEEILFDDRVSEIRDGLTGRALPYHYECVFRMIAGSAAHIRGECRGNPGSCIEPEDMSKRQCALLALDAYLDIQINRRQRVVIDV